MKHKWKKTDYDKRKIDDFAYEAGEYHNGPRCVRCGAGFCQHCHPERYDEACSPKAKHKEASNDKNLNGAAIALGKFVTRRK